MLKEQADRTPSPQWVRVIGGWTEFQFREWRMPTLEEINAASRDTPVFVLHLYDRAILNRAALRVLGYTRDTPNPPGGEIQRDSKGNPSGLLIAKPNALILYASLARGPKLPYADQINSTHQFMRELNRLGITSTIDSRLSPPSLPVSPDWSPVKVFGGYQGSAAHNHVHGACSENCFCGNHQHMSVMSDSGNIWHMGCDYFAF